MRLNVTNLDLQARHRLMVLIAGMTLLAAALAGLAYGFHGASFWARMTAPSQTAAIPIVRPEVMTTSDRAALRPISEMDAIKVNAAVPVAQAPNPSATPLIVPLGDGMSFMRSIDCMTAAVYYEAGQETIDGQRAVAQVILNRLRHPAYPHSVCGVVFQGAERRTGCQFTFTCDGSLARIPSKSGWERARAVATAALDGLVYSPVGWATHYHADYVVPYWASSLLKTATIGRHIFYRWSGGWGLPRAFAARYDGMEPLVSWNPQLIDGQVAMNPLVDALPGRTTTLDERPILQAGSAMVKKGPAMSDAGARMPISMGSPRGVPGVKAQDKPASVATPVLNYALDDKSERAPGTKAVN